MTHRIGFAVGPAFAACMAAGCFGHHAALPADCVVGGEVDFVRENTTSKVDVLFMVDDSNSMSSEQASLARAFPMLVTRLIHGDRDGDGAQDFAAVEDLHVGVVTSDMGNGGYMVPTCTSDHGDDGVLMTRGSRDAAACEATYPSFLTFAVGADATRFAHDFECVARVGAGGCGFEQQLESMLKAITPSTSGTVFAGGTLGHGDRENAGFLRSDSTLVLIAATDEDDCSTMDPALFASGPGNPYTGDLNLRCHRYPEVRYPITRYVDGFRAARASSPETIIYAAITGVPSDLVPDPARVDFDAILADPRMNETEQTVMMGGMTVSTGQLNPTCAEADGGYADPGRRMVQVAQAFGANGVVASICDADYGAAIAAIATKIAGGVGDSCLATRLERREDGTVACDVQVTLPSSGEVTTCAQYALQVPGVTRDGAHAGRETCYVPQSAVSGGSSTTGPGWYYDDFSADLRLTCAAGQSRIAFATGSAPPGGSELTIGCVRPLDALGAHDAWGTPCTADAACVGAEHAFCEDTTHTCQLGCATNADCPHGLVCSSPGVAGAFCVAASCG